MTTTRTTPARSCPSGDDATARKVTLTEAAIQRGVTDLLQQLGFECFHVGYMLGSTSAGFPDLIACDDRGRFVVAEFKGPRGRIRPGQQEWIERWRKAAGCVFSEIVGPEATDRWMGFDDALQRLQEVLTP